VGHGDEPAVLSEMIFEFGIAGASVEFAASIAGLFRIAGVKVFCPEFRMGLQWIHR
jgi:hypothetical protein